MPQDKIELTEKNDAAHDGALADANEQTSLLGANTPASEDSLENLLKSLINDKRNFHHHFVAIHSHIGKNLHEARANIQSLNIPSADKETLLTQFSDTQFPLTLKLSKTMVELDSKIDTAEKKSDLDGKAEKKEKIDAYTAALEEAGTAENLSALTEAFRPYLNKPRNPRTFKVTLQKHTKQYRNAQRAHKKERLDKVEAELKKTITDLGNTDNFETAEKAILELTDMKKAPIGPQVVDATKKADTQNALKSQIAFIDTDRAAREKQKEKIQEEKSESFYSDHLHSKLWPGSWGRTKSVARLDSMFAAADKHISKDTKLSKQAVFRLLLIQLHGKDLSLKIKDLEAALQASKQEMYERVGLPTTAVAKPSPADAKAEKTPSFFCAHRNTANSLLGRILVGGWGRTTHQKLLLKQISEARATRAKLHKPQRQLDLLSDITAVYEIVNKAATTVANLQMEIDTQITKVEGLKNPSSSTKEDHERYDKHQDTAFYKLPYSRIRNTASQNALAKALKDLKGFKATLEKLEKAATEDAQNEGIEVIKEKALAKHTQFYKQREVYKTKIQNGTPELNGGGSEPAAPEGDTGPSMA